VESVVEPKYESLRGGWRSKEVVGPFRVGVWKCMRRGWEVLSKFVRYEVGDGSKVRFWHDLCEDQPLKISYPDIFVSPMASIRLYCKYFDDNKLYLVALMYLLQV
jgi:hypothetical protein